MKTIFTSLLTFFLVSLAWAATPGQELQKILNSVETIQANFTQKNYAGSKSGNKVIRSSQGTLAIKKPGKFRWDITSPSKVSMISNGKLVWIYDKNLKQATVKKVSKNSDTSPVMVLSNRIRLLGNYFHVWQKNGWYYLNPKYGNDDLKQVQLKFNGNRLSKMWIFDKLGQRSYLQFSNVRINQKLADGQFNFRPPKGVDIIR